jgi:hypothetical protein
VASPWITEAAAKVISHELASVGPVSVQILARMDEADFLCGSSHIVAFRRNTYPGHVRVVFRALPMLHGKMLVADRERVILGSATLTEGGLYRNHEISLQVDSRELGEACAQEFFRLWSIASPIPDDCNVGRGTIAERLTRALLLEQNAVGRWSEEDVELLVCVMALTAAAIHARGKQLNIAAVAKHSADALGVASGDLRHGPLSPEPAQETCRNCAQRAWS